MKRPKGFTLVELLVVVAIIAMLVGMLLPTLGRAREIVRFRMCMTNLKSVGLALSLHMTESNDRFPLLTDLGNPVDSLSTTTDCDTVTASILGENAMQNVWILIDEGSVSEEHFKCPSDKVYKTRILVKGRRTKKYGWVSWENFSYGMHKPYSPTSGKNLAPLTQSKEGSFVIFADKNYGHNGSAGALYYTDTNNCRKPVNHTSDGFNYLMYSFSVQSAQYRDTSTGTDSQSRVGIGGDDIYRAGDDNGENMSTGAAVATADPTDDTDSFILPWQKPL